LGSCFQPNHDDAAYLEIRYAFGVSQAPLIRLLFNSGLGKRSEKTGDEFLWTLPIMAGTIHSLVAAYYGGMKAA
jgi:hypothetical protein